MVFKFLILFIVWSWIALRFLYAQILIIGIDQQDLIFFQVDLGLMGQCTLMFYIVFNVVFDDSSCNVWLE
jgi:hypothetical protein